MPYDEVIINYYNTKLVNKMKLKSLVCLFLGIICLNEAQAAATNPGLRYINARGKVICGTNTSAPAYAARDENGIWKGFDVDICRAFAIAVFGNQEKFEMKDVRTDQVAHALESNQIDIMLGGSPLSANGDAASRITPAGIIYYDKQIFLGRQAEDASSMEDYRDASVCVVTNSNDANNVEEFSNKYNLGLKILPFNSELRAKQAFLLNRCALLTGNQVYLRGIWDEHFQENPNVKIIPEEVALKPVYIMVAKDNPKLQAIARWVVNALQLSEMYGMSSRNANIQIGLKNTSQRNLVGADAGLWRKFGLRPDWVKKALAKIGNFGEIYERNFGEYSNLKINRDENNYLKDGGLLNPQPFL